MTEPSKIADYDIQPFKIDDYEDAIELWKSSEGITLNESDSREAIAALLARNPGYGMLVRTRSGKCIATVLCGNNGRAGHIYHLVVDKIHRGRGLGSTITQMTIDKLHKDNIPRCNIFVYSDNEDGNEFWLNTGWKDSDTWKVMQTMTSNC